MTKFKRLVSKKVLVPAILVVGALLVAIFVVSPIAYTLAQQRQFITDADMPTRIPGINGSVNVVDNMKEFFTENTKVPFTAAAETAQEQVVNSTLLGGRLGLTQGYLTYTFLVADPANETGHEVIVDAGNGQVLYISEGKSFNLTGPSSSSMFGGFGQWKGSHEFGAFGHGPLGLGFGPWRVPSGGFMGGDGIWH
jgi:uncharacterized membrane protein YkoI